MQIILLRKVDKLGQMGDIVNVKQGYARNYLIPMNFAYPATSEKIAEFKSMQIQLEATNLQKKEEAKKIAVSMQDLQITFIRSSSDTGGLYGSIRTRDIANSVTDKGFTIDKGQVLLDQPIKNIGLYNIGIQLHQDVKVDIMINVAMSEVEAEKQLKQ